MQQVIAAKHIFNGEEFLSDRAILINEGRVEAVVPVSNARKPDINITGLLVPAFIDLQVNGGGGYMVNGATTVEGLRRICAAHQALGTVGVLPTLITDTPEATAALVHAGILAAKTQVPGFLGLHLEGPHLDPRRKGVHDAALIRPMNEDDLQLLCDAARQLPVLMVTLAPEAASLEQISTLSAAGAIVSLGHSDCSYYEAEEAFAAGAVCATHLFNAMSQMGHRSPGLVGAVLSGSAAAGLIADGVHVNDAMMKIALAARDDKIFLVTDCMSFAGTDLTEMELHGRKVIRQDGKLTLEDGTLAGADLTLPQAVSRLIKVLGIPPARALRMASAIPAGLIGQDELYGFIRPGAKAAFLELGSDYQLLQKVGW